MSAVLKLPSVFAQHHEAYLEAGYRPRPVYPGGKGCKSRGWQLATWEPKPRHLTGGYGVGLATGSPFPDGTVLGAIDIDLDAYTALALALLGDPPCARFGSKGVVVPVRVPPNESGRALDRKDGTRVGELLFGSSFFVMPPTIHPETGQPYRWIGKPLLDCDWEELPCLT